MIPTTTVASPFVMPVPGSNADFVLLMPCDRYEGEWTYALRHADGTTVLRRAEPAFGDRDRLRVTDPSGRGAGQIIRRTEFNQFVIGRIVADITARDPGVMSRLGARRAA